MPILFVDSFDDRSITGGVIGYKWSSYSNSNNYAIAVPGRTGNGITSQADGAFSLRKDLAALQTFYMGLALKAGGNLTFAQFFDGGTLQLDLHTNGDGTISVRRGGSVVLGTSTQAISASAFAYLEFSATIDPSAGAFTLKMNGVTILSASGVNTRASANNRVTGYWIGDAVFNHAVFDDVYIADDQFYGGIKVLVTLPNGDGASTQWARTGGTVAGNYTAVNEASPDDNTSYVSSPNVGDLDLYDFANLPDPSVAVKALQVWTRHERDDVVTRKAKMVVRSAGTNYPQGEFTTAQNVWQDDVQVLATDPATGVAWTGAAVDAAQFGVQVTV